MGLAMVWARVIETAQPMIHKICLGVKASMGLDSTTCTKSELVAST